LQPDDVPADAIQPGDRSQDQRHRGGERDDERGDPDVVLLADVEEQVMPNDDEQPRREHPDRISQ
jgi:hypothetical protein